MQNLEFDAIAFEDLQWWVEHDRKKVLRVFKLIQEIQRTPYEGTGQPEPLSTNWRMLIAAHQPGASACIPCD